MIADHDQLLSMRTRAENDAFVLVALQRPVAGDLRAIVGTMQNVADVDRMGALALRVAKIARRLPGSALREEVIGYFAEMAHLAVELGNSANDAVLTGAGQIRHENDATDELHGHLFTVLTDPG